MGNLEQAVNFQTDVATLVWSSSPKINYVSLSDYKTKYELWITNPESLPMQHQQPEAILPDWSFEDFDANIVAKMPKNQ